MQRPFVTESSHCSKSVKTCTGSKALPVTSECAGLSGFGGNSKSIPWNVCRLAKSTAPNSVSSPLPGQGPVASQSTRFGFFIGQVSNEAPCRRHGRWHAPQRERAEKCENDSVDLDDEIA